VSRLAVGGTPTSVGGVRAEQVSCGEATMPGLPPILARITDRVRNNLRWSVAILLGLATVINYIDRGSLATAAIGFKDDFHITNVEVGWIIWGFQIAYLLMQPLMGRFMDWVGLKMGFMVSVAWWSVASMLHGLAMGWPSMTVCRFLLGVGEAGNFPGAAKAVREWFPPKERTLATGVYNSGASVGMLVAAPLVAGIMYYWNWRVAFLVTGAIGFLWIILWRLIYQPLATCRWITNRERSHIESGQADLAVTEPPPEHGAWRIVLPQRNFWGIALARFLSEPAWQFFVFFIPLYLHDERGWAIKDLALYGWLPFVGADLGCLLGGMVPPLFQKMGLSLLTARKAAATVAGVIMLTAVFIGGAPSAAWAVFFISVAAYAHQSMSSVLLTLPADLFPKRTVATAFGLAGSVGYIGGLGFILVVGYVTAAFGYTPLFTIIAFLDLIGAALVWILIRKPKTESEMVTEMLEVDNGSR
jgi:MFS transporter, ACS family, hexuronate transporter